MNHTVLITGATSGFGAAIARRLASAGAQLVLTGRRRERLETLKSDLGSNRVHVIAFDIRDTDAYGAAIRRLPGEYANIDVLVNNAGLALSRNPAQDTEFEDWRTMVDTNIKGLIFGTHALLPGMLDRGHGHIVNIGSTAGHFPTPGNAIYGATKAFVHLFSLNLRADLLGTPIRVTEVSPGLVGGTEFSNIRYKGEQSKIDALYADAEPLTAGDIADTVHWVVTRPPHVNINSVEVMPVCQAFAPMAIHRRSDDTPRESK